MWRVVIYGALFMCTVGGEEVRLVSTPQGPIRGYKDPENDIYVFYNIPYATAPTGVHRFQAPAPVPTWSEPLDAIDRRMICYQADHLLNYVNPSSQKRTMTEDCLIANVYVPNTVEKNLPVYVYVHGGGFAYGYGDFMTPKKLVSSKKIIAVTFNYRLGPLGFLCLGTEDIPGNAGMKDQVALLRWVKANIAGFGGNPDDVTIGGESAGSASVDLLMLSKMAEGLFNKVIGESGASTSVFTVQRDPIDNAKEYAKLIHLNDTEDIEALSAQYKSIPYESLFTNAIETLTGGHPLMSPCVEREVRHETFLEKDPVNILKNGSYKKVPMLYGFTNMEGLIFVDNFEVWFERMNKNFSDFLPADLKFDNQYEKEEVAKSVKDFYFGDKDVGQDILGYIDYFSDTSFKFSFLRNVKLQVEAGNNQIYLYEYAYVDEETPVIPTTDVRGATHCAQSAAVMDNIDVVGLPVSYSHEYEKVREIYRKVWLNFITTGKPVPDDSELPEWPPTGAYSSPHMLLNNTMELRGPLLKEKKEFWDKIYDKHYRHPVPPTVLKLNAEL